MSIPFHVVPTPCLGEIGLFVSSKWWRSSSEVVLAMHDPKIDLLPANDLPQGDTPA